MLKYMQITVASENMVSLLLYCLCLPAKCSIQMWSLAVFSITRTKTVKILSQDLRWSQDKTVSQDFLSLNQIHFASN